MPVKKKVVKKQEDVVIKLPAQTAILVFDLNESREEYEQTRDAGNMAGAISEIQGQLFRPSYKHGYSDENIRSVIGKINAVLEKSNLKDEEGDNLRAESLISVLMDKYHSILSDWGVDKYA